jgi:hypothetical protein
MAAKKGTFAVSLDLSSPEKVDEFMEALVRDLFGCTVEEIKRDIGEEQWQQHRQELIQQYSQ